MARLEMIQKRIKMKEYKYHWPFSDLTEKESWRKSSSNPFFMVKNLPESPKELARDSRWPAFFPATVCLVTASDGSRALMERSVGATIVNRFPYVLALTFCSRFLSDRHYPRENFIRQVKVENYYNQLISYLKVIARRRGRKLAIVIDGRAGSAATNRPQIFDHLISKRRRMRKVKLRSDKDTNFNNYDIRDSVYLVD